MVDSTGTYSGPLLYQDAVNLFKSQHMKDEYTRFRKLCEEEADLHEKKNKDYAGDGAYLGNFERVGDWIKAYPALSKAEPKVRVLVLYMLKQVDAVLWGLGEEGAKNESLSDRLRDISIYAKILTLMLQPAVELEPTSRIETFCGIDGPTVRVYVTRGEKTLFSSPAVYLSKPEKQILHSNTTYTIDTNTYTTVLCVNNSAYARWEWKYND